MRRPPKAARIAAIAIIAGVIGFYGIIRWLGSAKEEWDYTGYLEARVADLSFETPGKIVALEVHSGERLRAGAPMAVLDTVQLHIQLSEVRAHLEAIRAKRRGVEEQLDYWEGHLERLKQVGTGVSADQIMALESKLEQLENQIESLASEERAAEASENRVKELLSRCILRAPKDGEVMDVTAEVGEIASPGFPVIRFGYLDTLDVYFFVPEKDVPLLNPGDSVWVKTEGLREWFGARVEWISPEAQFTPKLVQTREDRETLVFKVRARVANPDHVLKAGLPVDVKRNRPSF